MKYDLPLQVIYIEYCSHSGVLKVPDSIEVKF